MVIYKYTPKSDNSTSVYYINKDKAIRFAKRDIQKFFGIEVVQREIYENKDSLEIAFESNEKFLLYKACIVKIKTKDNLEVR